MGGSGNDNGWRDTPSVDAARLGGVEKLPDPPSGRDLLQETVISVIQNMKPDMSCPKRKCNDDLHESM